VPPGAIHAGRTEVADIGITVPDTGFSLSEAADVAALLPRRALDSHKRNSGSVALLGGSAGMSGAIILAARAAMRAGAGYATVGVTQGVDAVVSVAVPEILSRIVSDSDVLGPDALDAFKDVIERTDVLAIGPGLGASQPQAGLVEAVLRRIDVPVVVDADGLNVLAGDSGALARRTAPVVVTPHPGELSRLLGVSTAAVQKDRVGSARSAAERFGSIVVLKGFRSLIAEPSGRLVVNPTGGPELATAGTGDVLTGVVAALIGGGLDPFEAAWAAAYLHGLAGSIAAQSKGPTGVVASDVADALPRARIAVASSP
jgi:ADP-dependent NAD(P)H-hydrate dehydratase / NAD(P)H-hydrate epimerase